MRWPGIERVWLPEWLDDPDATADRLVAAVEAAEAGGASAQPRRSRALRPRRGSRALGAEEPSELLGEEVLGVQDAGVTHPHVRPFVPWSMTTWGGVAVLDALPNRSAAEQVRAALVEVIAAEGPISRARLVRLVAESFGLSRVSGNRATAILGLIPMLTPARATSNSPGRWTSTSPPGGMFGRARRGRADRSSPLLWKKSRTRWPLSPNSAVGCARTRSSARPATVRGKRMTTQISERLADALTVAVATRRVELAPSGAYLARF